MIIRKLLFIVASNNSFNIKVFGEFGRHRATVPCTMRSTRAGDQVAAVEADQGAQVLHHGGGALDLRGSLPGGFGHLIGVAAAGAEGLINEACISMCRHQGLIELMGHGGSKLFHAAQTRESRHRSLVQVQYGSGRILA